MSDTFRSPSFVNDVLRLLMVAECHPNILDEADTADQTERDRAVLEAARSIIKDLADRGKSPTD